MNQFSLNSNEKYILTKTVIGYCIYQKPYYLYGHRCSGLIISAGSKEELIKALEEKGCQYIEIDTHPDNIDYMEFSKLFREKYNNADINN